MQGGACEWIGRLHVSLGECAGVVWCSVADVLSYGLDTHALVENQQREACDCG